MKKIIILIVLMVCVTGCGKCPECPKCEETEKVDVKEEKRQALEAKLLEFGKLIYENDTWMKGNIEPDTYFMTLREMKDRNNYDISMFINPDTNLSCDLDRTRIEFIVKEKTQNKTEYELNAVLDCGF